MKTESDRERDLDFLLLREGPISLYWRREKFETALGWFESAGYTVARFDCRSWTDLNAFHASLASGLGFPEYYGGTFHALNDCLGELEEPLTTGLAVALEHFDAFAARHGDEAHTFLDLFAQHSRRELLYNGRMLALVQSDDPHLSLAPVGAVPVLWNREEWTDAARGIPPKAEA